MAKLATEIIVTAPNRLGQLAAIGRSLADAGVNIAAISANASGRAGTIRLLFANEDGATARRALEGAGYRIGKSGIRKVVTVSGAHKPGTLARVADRLAKAKVNIDSAYLAGQTRKRVTLALGVGKDAAKAKRALA